MGQDYLKEVRQSLAAAAAKKAAERAEEARKQRSAKVLIIGLLITVFTFIALFGDNLT